MCIGIICDPQYPELRVGGWDLRLRESTEIRNHFVLLDEQHEIHGVVEIEINFYFLPLPSSSLP